MEEQKSPSKIDKAIEDTRLRLKHVEQELQLMLREKKVLNEQLDTLQAIKKDKSYG